MKKKLLLFLSIIVMLIAFPVPTSAEPVCTKDDYCDSILIISEQKADIPFTGDSSWMNIAGQLFDVEVQYSDGLDYAIDPDPVLIYACSTDGQTFDNCAKEPFVNVGVYTVRVTAAQDEEFNYLESYADSTLTITDAAGVDPDGLAVVYHNDLADSGTAVEDSSVYAFGDEVIILSNLGLDETGTPNPLTKAGYTFNSWNSAADLSGESYSFGDQINITLDLDLYPEWKAIAADGSIAESPIIIAPAAEEALPAAVSDPANQPSDAKSVAVNDKFQIGDGWFTANDSVLVEQSAQDDAPQAKTLEVGMINDFTVGKDWYVAGEVLFKYPENTPAVQQPEPEESADLAVVDKGVAEMPTADPEIPVAIIEAEPAEERTAPTMQVTDSATLDVLPLPTYEIFAEESPAELPLTEEVIEEPVAKLADPQIADPKGLDEDMTVLQVQEPIVAEQPLAEPLIAPQNRMSDLEFSSDNRMPETGFSTQRLTSLRDQPASLAYTNLHLQLDMPVLGIKTDIVSVPDQENGWAVEWLRDNAGLLEGSALPGEGVSYIAAHNHLNALETGPFVFISTLNVNDRIFVHNAENELIEFSVVANALYEPQDFALVQEKADAYKNALVLITCENEATDGSYLNRRVIFAEQL